MKRLSKRIVSLMMALVMLLSCSVTTYGQMNGVRLSRMELMWSMMKIW